MTDADPLGERLSRARAALGHTQEQCAARLRELGHAKASQTSVWRWESGAVQAPHVVARRAIDRYIAEAAVEHVTGPTEVEAFEAAVRDLTAEPLFGELQREFLLARIKRHGNGPPLGEHDREEVEDLARTLRLSLD
jgi:transcriptional regulator with XRE-family HTH domain